MKKGQYGQYVDVKIRMLENVYPWYPVPLTEPVLERGKEYQAEANWRGAIFAVTMTGKKLGVKPREFEFLSAPAWVLDIWKKKYPEMCSNCKIEEEAQA